MFAVNVNGLQLWKGGGPALPHPDHRLVTASTDLELLDVPSEEGKGAPNYDGDDEEDLPDVVLTEGPPLEASSPCPEVPQTFPPLQGDPVVLKPELVSPSYLPSPGTDREVPDEFFPDLPDEDILPEEVHDPEPEDINS